MFSIKYIKAGNTTYLMQFKNGQVKRQGKGLSFWYLAQNTSLVAVPTNATEVPFMFKESTSDFQEVTLQGQLVYRVCDPERLASSMNFTLSADQQGYISDDPEKIKSRLVRLIQVAVRNSIEKMPLRAALTGADELIRQVRSVVSNSETLIALGIEVIDLALLAIKPSPETARALEAAVREQLLQEADDAIYIRRNASIEQERKVKENELNTELAVQAKQKQLQQERLAAERALKEEKRAIAADELKGEIEREAERQNLIALSTDNERKQADAKAYEIGETMKAWSQVDPAILEAMALSKLEPQQLLAQAFRELASNSAKIGQLNIAPDLLEALAGRRN